MGHVQAAIIIIWPFTLTFGCTAIVMFVLACVVAGKPAVARCLEGVKAAGATEQSPLVKGEGAAAAGAATAAGDGFGWLRVLLIAGGSLGLMLCLFLVLVYAAPVPFFEPVMPQALESVGFQWRPPASTMHNVPPCSVDDIASGRDCRNGELPADEPMGSQCRWRPVLAPNADSATGECACNRTRGAELNLADVAQSCALGDIAVQEGVNTSNVPVAAPRVTFVTSYVSIGRANNADNADDCKYLRRFAHWAQAEMNLVIFAAPATLRLMTGVRRKWGLANRTVGRPLTGSYDSLPFGQLLPRMYENVLRTCWKFAFTGFATGVVEHLSPEYGMLNHAKAGMLQQAITQNDFGSDFFFWVDAGAGKESVPFFSPWCPCSATGVLPAVTVAAEDWELLATYTEAYYFDGGAYKTHYEAPVGGMWGGAASALLKYYDVYSELVGKVTDYGITDDDQPINSMAYNRHLGYVRVLGAGFFPYDRFC